MNLYFSSESFGMNDEFEENKPARKGKKSFKAKKKRGGEDFDRVFGNNKKRNKPRRGGKDKDAY